MTPIDPDGFLHHAERSLRNYMITFENGRRIEIPEIHAMSIEFDKTDTSDTIQSYVEQQVREEHFRKLTAELEAAGVTAQDAMDAMRYSMQSFARTFGPEFISDLNGAWVSLGDEFELADEAEYIATDPISFDELMGGDY